MKRSSISRSGFSLIEVSMTVGIVAFALVGMLGVLPIALQQSRACVDETRAAQLARMIFSTVQSEPFTAARCFGKVSDAPVNLATLDANSPPVLLFASYQVRPFPAKIAGGAEPAPASIEPAVPWIARADTPPPETEYRIELRFEPAPTGSVGPSSTPAPARGSAMHVSIRAERTPGTVVFEGVQFLNRLQRRATAR